MICKNSVVSEWKENFRLSQPNPSIFWRHFVYRCRGNKHLVNHFIMITVIPESSLYVNAGRFKSIKIDDRKPNRYIDITRYYSILINRLFKIIYKYYGDQKIDFDQLLVRVEGL